MRSTAALSCSKSVTSVRMRRALPPACSISRCARSNSALLRASKPTLAPAAAKPRASRLPIPRPAPVISTPVLVRECTCEILPINGSTERPGLGRGTWLAAWGWWLVIRFSFLVGCGLELESGFFLGVHRFVGAVEELFGRLAGQALHDADG